ALWRRRPVVAASGRRLGIGGCRFMSPLEPVIVDEATPEIGAEVSVEARIILVGIDDAGASGWRFTRHRSVCRVCTADHRRQRDARQKKSFHILAPSCCYRRLQA